MIVPTFWAEARLQQRAGKKQVTLRRFGWSDASLDEAQRMADERVKSAMERAVRGEKLLRREPRIAYNGAEGVPIREEILARDGATVITRNSYGAHCLNTPDVLFADVDFDGIAPLFRRTASALVAFATYAAAAIGLQRSLGFNGLWLIAATLLWYPLIGMLQRASVAVRGGAERIAMARVRKFMGGRDDWALRVYRTPSGLRLLATHRPFSPTETATREFFAAVGVDRLYATMCERQHCFRARLTAKPWRIGIAQHMRPRPGVWPVNPERLADRSMWIAGYELVARDWAACRFVTTVGSGATHADVEPVRRLHDDASRATSSLPIA